MATYTMTISPGVFPVASSDQAGKVCCLGDGDAIIAQVGSVFGPTAHITAVNFFVSSPNKASGTRFTRFTTSSTMNKAATITYPAGNPAGAIQLFSINAPSSQATVTITDAEGPPPAAQHVWYSIEITDVNGNVWTLDPEVINTPSADPRRGFSPPAEGDGTQTLGTTSDTSAAPMIVTRGPSVPTS